MTFEEFKTRFQRVPVSEQPNHTPEHPAVSVCVITYNHGKFIGECLDGILNQKTDFPIEVLVGEDGSTDGTREICLRYAKEHPDKIRLFLHHRENNLKVDGNPSGRFNFLYNFYSARGEYIALCDGDDYWTDPLKLQKQYSYLNENPKASFCFHLVRLIDGKHTVLSEPSTDGEVQFFSKHKLKISKIPSSSLFFRKKLLDPIAVDFCVDIPWGDVYFKSILAKNGTFAQLGFVGADKRMEGGITDIDLYTKYYKSYRSLFYTSLLVNDKMIFLSLRKRIKTIFWIYLFKSLRSGKYKTAFKLLRGVQLEKES